MARSSKSRKEDSFRTYRWLDRSATRCTCGEADQLCWQDRQVISDEDVRQLLRRSWGLDEGTQVARHDGGMGSQTWIVSQGERRWVAKSVAPHLADSLAHGLEVARMLDAAGIRSGAPAPTRSGSIAVDTPSGDRVALLTWVPGSPLTGADEAEQRLIGDTLARVHRVLRNRQVPGAQRFHWVDPAAAHLELRPWLRPAVTAAVDALTALQNRPPPWTQGLLHADPAPEAFRLDLASGQCGIIDWSSAHDGPLLYDLASAVMYLGGPARAAAMTGAYQAAGLLTEREIADGLPVLLRFRWAVQADYFARRITANDLTGITGPEENEKGLDDARLALLEARYR
jgi:Ser/Thr protein kinase RdoA (MazF antagonist)